MRIIWALIPTTVVRHHTTTTTFMERYFLLLFRLTHYFSSRLSLFFLFTFVMQKNVFAISFSICLLFLLVSLSLASFFSYFFPLIFSQVNYSGFLVPANFCLMCSPFLQDKNPSLLQCFTIPYCECCTFLVAII